MKRAKDDDSTMEPMFPRLHVNDTDKGGPRAPPRNKMALYEQFSVPSQRHNRGVLPLNPSNNGGLFIQGSSNQVNVGERNSWSFLKNPPSQTQMGEAFRLQHSEGENLSSSLTHRLELTMRGDHEGFTVPVFSNPSVTFSHCRTRNSVDMEKPVPVLASNLNHTRNCEESTVQNQELEGHSSRNCDNAHKLGVLKRKDSTIEPQKVNVPIDVDAVYDKYDGVEPVFKSHLREVDHSTDEVVYDDEHCRAATCRSPPLGNGELSDGVSGTSVVDSISSFDVSPDIVVRVIGQKRFWKARKAIANQQRLFAVQVFELHRLIRVQRLIAGSPSVMFEDGAYIRTLSPKSSVKELPLPEYAQKALPQVANEKDNADKDVQKIEGSAENAVSRKNSTSSNQALNSMLFPGNTPQDPTMGANTQVAPWPFPQSQGHQWLVPVMSPSEGLIYKPYPGPGMMGPVCGGYGPFGTTPTISGSFVGSYGVPAPPISHGYFPPYGVAIFPGSFMGPGSKHYNDVTSGLVGQTDVPERHCCDNVPSQEERHLAQPRKRKASTESLVLGSRVSSLNGERFPEESSQALRSFPSETSAPTRVSWSAGGKPTRVIKVVPHNPNLAPESAARIFQSIQAERKQYDLA